MSERLTRGLSWALGPVESHLVRALLYLAFGWVPAHLVVGWLPVVVSFPPALLLFSQALILVSLVLFVYFVFGQLDRIKSIVLPSLRWFYLSFNRVSRPRWFVVATLVDALILSLLKRWLGWELFDLVSLTLVLVCSFAALLLSSRGEIDAATKTLLYNTPLSTVKWHEIDFDEEVADVTRARLGQRTYLWLSFKSGTRSPLAFRGPFMVPTEILDRAWPRFKAGRDTTTEPS